MTDLPATTPLICSDERHQAKVAALQAELDEARAEQNRFRTMYNVSEARVNDLIDERDKLSEQLTTMTDVARSNRKHVHTIVPELDAATARAKAAKDELTRSEMARNVLRRTLVSRTQRAERAVARAEEAEAEVQQWRDTYGEHALRRTLARLHDAEAAIARVRAVADEWGEPYHCGWLSASVLVRQLRTALDGTI